MRKHTRKCQGCYDLGTCYQHFLLKYPRGSAHDINKRRPKPEDRNILADIATLGAIGVVVAMVAGALSALI